VRRFVSLLCDFGNSVIMKRFKLTSQSMIALLFIFFVAQLCEFKSVLEFPNRCGEAKVAGGNIIGGRPAAKGNFPWLGVLCKGGTREKCFCGATLITKNHAISAAHCFLPKKNQELNNTYWPDVMIHFGGSDLKADDEEFQSRKLKDVVIHHEWKTGSYDQSYDSDIAVLRLGKPVKFSQFVQPICLPPEGEFTGNKGTVVS